MNKTAMGVVVVASVLSIIAAQYFINRWTSQADIAFEEMFPATLNQKSFVQTPVLTESAVYQLLEDINYSEYYRKTGRVICGNRDTVLIQYAKLTRTYEGTEFRVLFFGVSDSVRAINIIPNLGSETQRSYSYILGDQKFIPVHETQFNTFSDIYAPKGSCRLTEFE